MKFDSDGKVIAMVQDAVLAVAPVDSQAIWERRSQALELALRYAGDGEGFDADDVVDAADTFLSDAVWAVIEEFIAALIEAMAAKEKAIV